MLGKFVAALSPQRRVDQLLLNWLITLSAARDRAEALHLDVLLGAPTATATLVKSTTLWSAPGLRTGPALMPFVRYLGLRALAARTGDALPTWQSVFEALRDSASVESDDPATMDENRAALLHHQLALGETATVASELDTLLAELPATQWLALVDHIVITPPLANLPTPDRKLSERAVVIARLLTALRTEADLGLSHQDDRRTRLALIDDDYRLLAPMSTNRAEFIQRAQHFRALSDALS